MYYPDTTNPSVEWMKVENTGHSFYAVLFLGQKEVSRSKEFKSWSRAFAHGEATLEQFKAERAA